MWSPPSEVKKYQLRIWYSSRAVAAARGAWRAVRRPNSPQAEQLADRARPEPLDRLDVDRIDAVLQATATFRFFFLASAPAARMRCTPGASVASGFSMKTCLPAVTAASKCSGRKPGGWAMTTTSTPLANRCL